MTNIRLTLTSLSLLILTLPQVRAEEDTASFFRLDDLFAVEQEHEIQDPPAAPEAETAEPTAPKIPAALTIPDTSAWRIPRSILNPETEPPPADRFTEEELAVIEKFANMDRRPRERNPFVIGGRPSIAPTEGHSRLRFPSAGRRLRAEYILRNESLGEELRFLHSAETSETLAVPEGVWIVELNLWFPERPNRVLELIYEPATLYQGSEYTFNFPANAERRVAIISSASGFSLR